MTTAPENEQVPSEASEQTEATATPAVAAEIPLEQASLPAQRKRLPDTRSSITHKFNIAGHEGYITAGIYADGKPGEVFIKLAKEGSTLAGMADTIGILTSLCLQYGVPVEALTHKLSGTRYEPLGHTKHPEIPTATSLSDYLVRWLELTFTSNPSQHSEPAEGSQNE